MDRNTCATHGHRLLMCVVAVCAILNRTSAQQAEMDRMAFGAPQSIDGRPDDWLSGGDFRLTYDPGFRVGYAMRTDGIYLFLLIHARVDAAQLRTMNIRAAFGTDNGTGMQIAELSQPDSSMQAVQVAPDGSVWYEGQFPINLVRQRTPVANQPPVLAIRVDAMPNEVGLATALGLHQQNGMVEVNRPWFGSMTTLIKLDNVPMPPLGSHGMR